MKASGVSLERHWPLKALAGLLLGPVIALGVSGLFAWWGPGGIEAESKPLVTLWLVPPLWMIVLSVSVLFRSIWGAWTWLGLAAFLAYALLITVSR